MTPRAAWALVFALLWAGQVQAWHAPTHIDDYGAPTLHQESCTLGVNGHGVALPPASGLRVPVLSSDLQELPLPAFHAPSVNVALLPPLRGPPISVWSF